MEVPYFHLKAQYARIDPARIEAAITSRTRAIGPVALEGGEAPLRAS